MDESKLFDRVILKILNGVQVGAEVSLVPGEYSIGSGNDDDIQLIDVSLQSGQARLRIAPGKIEIAGGSGGVTVGGSTDIAAGSEWHDVEPLDIITVGMMRLVLAPPNANWTTLIEQNEPKSEVRKSGLSAFVAALPSALKLNGRTVRLAMPVAALLGVIGIGVAYLAFGSRERSVPRVEQADTERVARAALDQFPFGRAVALKREVDGTVFASGFVKDGFERRALVAAVDKTGAQVYFRLGVLEALRSEIEGLIKSEKMPVSYTLSPNGELTLDGVVLNEEAARQFVEKLRGSIAGLNAVESRIRTGRTLLDDVQKIARTAQIDQFVLLRLDGELIEASGILPIEKIDSWVGFLTSYSRRVSKDIPLRSFVQLQKPDGTLVGAATLPVTLGAQGGDRTLDRDKLLQGQYRIDDLFAGASPQVADAKPTGSVRAAASSLMAPRVSADPLRLAERANELLAGWRRGADDATARDFEFLLQQRLAIARRGNADEQTDRDKAVEKYMPLLATGNLQGIANACRVGSRLTTENLPTAIFWLDLLSISNSYSLTEFAQEDQAFILEAALDPRLATECLARIPGDIAPISLYLSEAPRNPDFIRFLLRDFRPYALDVSGASVVGSRYVQTRSGERMREGGAPDGASRLALVGELGSVIQQKNGYATVIYAQQLNWLNQR
ncbi:hypothetical protein XH83_13150 [Bradyrhizobium sp. CCBAU 53351]|uniref:hypothetical protein n=1 Tax=Bradyrhizobium sp. CCBAU 53351 TaxID=1325114 RepID=UPI001888D018|nr:hypothetical protein [Bradyrhizobium sp. CCBAU 53351]QOZ76309.1 hypothetical protein XH83_13150 [Bradyrhizobium sp. CCBAU 53351]